ncbi:hypothetical protein EMPG_11441 [Blastomyces silverae]|uniref:Uncharacterized protein n=1 Tax=Blastomyces silverae TaxID=2060906 RepID=A0A0H1BQH8_9EURO|nr:hypothetical protein EMPG_11441 [Blastomyces silverae]
MLSESAETGTTLSVEQIKKIKSQHENIKKLKVIILVRDAHLSLLQTENKHLSAELNDSKQLNNHLFQMIQFLKQRVKVLEIKLKKSSSFFSSEILMRQALSKEEEQNKHFKTDISKLKLSTISTSNALEILRNRTSAELADSETDSSDKRDSDKKKSSDESDTEDFSEEDS